MSSTGNSAKVMQTKRVLANRLMYNTLFVFQQIIVRNLKRSEYRNAVRSYGLICGALLELLDEKPFDKIIINGHSSIASC